jgi:hypothetical protein
LIAESWEQMALTFPEEMRDLAVVAYNQTSLGSTYSSFVDLMPQSIYQPEIQDAINRGLPTLNASSFDRFMDLFASQAKNQQFLPKIAKNTKSGTFGATYAINNGFSGKYNHMEEGKNGAMYPKYSDLTKRGNEAYSDYRDKKVKPNCE